LKVRGRVETGINLGGILIPTTLLIVYKLSYDVIIGLDQETMAVIYARTNMHLFDGLTSIPMTNTGEHAVVQTVSDVTMPPISEAVVNVNCPKRLEKGEDMIEGELKSPCKSLIVARTLINATKVTYPCRVMNPTEKAIT